MSYSALKQIIDQNITTNGRMDITGAKLNGVLKSMVTSLGESGFQFVAKANPTDNPGTPEQKVWYLASTAGTYTNFGNIQVAEGEVVILTYDGSWHKIVTGAATAAEVTQLGHEVGDLENKTESVSGEHIFQAEDMIQIFDENGNKVAEIDQNGANFKDLKSNGEDVLTGSKTSFPSMSEKIVLESNDGDFIGEFDIAKLQALADTRRKIRINTTDTEFDILDKFILADEAGDTDVIFERGVYTLSSIYLYMRDTLGWTGNRFGLPIGHNNRYYFNGSTIISNNPTGFIDVRDALVTRTINGNFELYDGIIVNNGGQYCIHDEGGGYSTPYSHYYKNMVLKYNGTTGQPFGCGTGFDANLRFEECIFETTWTGATTFSIHGPISNPDNDPVSVDLRIDGCYFNSLNISINQTYFDGARDNLFLRVANSRMFGAVSDTNFEIISFNNTIS